MLPSRPFLHAQGPTDNAMGVKREREKSHDGRVRATSTSPQIHSTSQSQYRRLLTRLLSNTRLNTPAVCNAQAFNRPRIPSGSVDSFQASWTGRFQSPVSPQRRRLNGET